MVSYIEVIVYTYSYPSKAYFKALIYREYPI